MIAIKTLPRDHQPISPFLLGNNRRVSHPAKTAVKKMSNTTPAM
jgi:hypothetical protein